MRRRQVVPLVLGAIACASSVEVGAQTNRTPRVGMLAGGTGGETGSSECFIRGLRDVGYEDGRNMVLEQRSATGRMAQVRNAAAELVRLNVDVIWGSGTVGAVVAHEATRTIPIVFATVADPIRTGLVASLTRPGGNATGLTTINTELIGKRLALLKEILPAMSRLAHLINPDDPSNLVGIATYDSAARALGLELLRFEMRGPEEFERAFAAMAGARIEALAMASGAMVSDYPKELAALALKHRIPTIFSQTAFARAGGLMSYSADFCDLARRSAVYVDRILKGAKPADLPVEQANKFELVINLKTAKALGVTIPQSFLLRADEVIE